MNEEEVTSDGPLDSPPPGRSILYADLQAAWRHAVRAYNYCENAEMCDSAANMAEIVVLLSQQLEFELSMMRDP